MVIVNLSWLIIWDNVGRAVKLFVMVVKILGNWYVSFMLMMVEYIWIVVNLLKGDFDVAVFKTKMRGVASRT